MSKSVRCTLDLAEKWPLLFKNLGECDEVVPRGLSGRVHE